VFVGVAAPDVVAALLVKGSECFSFLLALLCFLLLVFCACWLLPCLVCLLAHVKDSSCSGHEECRFNEGGVWNCVDAGAPLMCFTVCPCDRAVRGRA